mmetsp:Transcript_20719/g.62037  ORF Transcript_20719/g.62037 Transcript_20719/m.62037 type:complete len:222 (-) Transcript_20719:303-968(-)
MTAKTTSATSSRARSPAVACLICPCSSIQSPAVMNGVRCSARSSQARRSLSASAGCRWSAGFSPTCSTRLSRRLKRARTCTRRPSSGVWSSTASWLRLWRASPPITRTKRPRLEPSQSTPRACRTAAEPRPWPSSTRPHRTSPCRPLWRRPGRICRGSWPRIGRVWRRRTRSRPWPALRHAWAPSTLTSAPSLSSATPSAQTWPTSTAKVFWPSSRSLPSP